MKKVAVAGVVALVFGISLYVFVQQTVPTILSQTMFQILVLSMGGRRGGGPPGGGSEIGMNTWPPNGEGQKLAFVGQIRVFEEKFGVAFDVVIVIEGFAYSWGLAFLSDGRMLVIEKQLGRFRIVSVDGKQISEFFMGLLLVDVRGQGGLLDIALDPAFAKNQLIYWSYSESGIGVNNSAVVWGRLVDGAMFGVDGVQVIFRQVLSLNSILHFGGWLVFGCDGMLFVTFGDRSIIEGCMQAQWFDGLFGKIVRINPDGSIPKDNPFVGKSDVRSEIWSYGYRNVQVAMLYSEIGELWEVEHGICGGDELNVVRKGKDYGWSMIVYGIEYQGGPIIGAIQ